jgi:hypothetical protein
LRYFSDDGCPGRYERETRSSCREGATQAPYHAAAASNSCPLEPFLYEKNRRRPLFLEQGMTASLGTVRGKDGRRETTTE